MFLCYHACLEKQVPNASHHNDSLKKERDDNEDALSDGYIN